MIDGESLDNKIFVFNSPDDNLGQDLITKIPILCSEKMERLDCNSNFIQENDISEVFEISDMEKSVLHVIFRFVDNFSDSVIVNYKKKSHDSKIFSNYIAEKIRGKLKCKTTSDEIDIKDKVDTVEIIISRLSDDDDIDERISNLVDAVCYGIVDAYTEITEEKERALITNDKKPIF